MLTRVPSTSLSAPPREAWHALSAAEAASRLGTDIERGLSEAEARRRSVDCGPNVLDATRPEPWWAGLLESLTEPLVLLLVGVAVLYALFGEIGDAVTIGAVIVAVAAVEAFNEGRARRAIASLRALGAPSATVIREGHAVDVPATALVLGDVVQLAPGDRVPADLRLAQTAALRIDESTLTGESEAAAKSALDAVPEAAALGDRVDMAYAATLVTAGKGRGLVVATGSATELGQVARLAGEARESRTPLQVQMRELAGWLLWLALGFSALVPVLGVLVAHRSPQEMALTGLTLAFATIPEELPILITIVLGLGAFDLARRRAIVRRLAAAETLGSVTVVGTDKTGTLTENVMRVAEIHADDRRRLLEVAALANDAEPVAASGPAAPAGDPVDVALLAAAEAEGVDVRRVRGSVEAIVDFPFDETRKRASAVYRASGVLWMGVKGAPEDVLARCTHRLSLGVEEVLEPSARADARAQVEDMAARGLRVLAVAQRRLARGQRPGDGPEMLERELELLGLVGLRDPPRDGARDAVAALQRAGIRTLMLTGDHPATARAIAAHVGLDAGRVVLAAEVDAATDQELRTLVGQASVFARVTPAGKLRIVRALSKRGEVVAATGDGVNDAPALREAAVGVAMGRSGTDIAREAADIVLADDDLGTMVEAVRTGRALYDNLRKAVRFYLAAKVALVSASLVSVLAQLAVPFTPLQIIVLELFMDLGAATTFVAEPPEGDVMARPPRDARRPFMDAEMLSGVFGGGLLLAAAVLTGYLGAWVQTHDLARAQTSAFAAWMVGHLVLAAFMRSRRSSPLRRTLLTNVPFVLWVVAAAALLALGTQLPPLRERLHLASLTPLEWLAAGGAGLVFPSIWGVIQVVLSRRGRARRLATPGTTGIASELGYPSARRMP